MTAVLRVVISDTGETLKIPNQALRFRPNGTGRLGQNNAPASVSSSGNAGTVWVIGNVGNPTALEVKLGVGDENSTQLLGGSLQAGQQLIVGIATPQSRAGAFGLRLGF
jgi:HlyD family secretion protein